MHGCAVRVLAECTGVTARGHGCDHYPRPRRDRIELKGRQFLTLSGPIVYAWYRNDLRCRYVGLSERGLRRLFGKHQHAAEIGPKDVIRLFPCRTLEEAKKLERRLIRWHRPDLNKLWNPDCPDYADGKLSPPKRERAPLFKSPFFRRGPRP